MNVLVILGKGWADFDFEAAFKCPTKVVIRRYSRLKDAK